MQTLPRSYRRLGALVASVPLLLVVLGAIYSQGMWHLEDTERSLAEGIAWAAETITTVGYGHDATWAHPLMRTYVILVEFTGVMYLFLIFPVFFIPFFGERFEARLARRLPRLVGEVLIYNSGPAVTSFVDELEREGIPAVFLEEDEAAARRLRDRHPYVVLGDLTNEDLNFKELSNARGLVLNGDDDKNAAMALGARAQGFKGPIVAIANNPASRPAMLRVGVTAAFSPDHLLAEALAGRASEKMRRRVTDVSRLGPHLEVFELRVEDGSLLAGKTLGEAGIRETTGTTIVALWEDGQLVSRLSPDLVFRPGTILVAVGPEAGLEKLSTLATPIPGSGHFVVIGFGEVGRKVAELLTDAGEEVVVVAVAKAPGVDIVGDFLDFETLELARLTDAQGIILALGDDNSALFAGAVIRSLAPEKKLIVGTKRLENVARIHSAGADYALSLSQVARNLLSRHILDRESLALEADITLLATNAGSFAGQRLVTRTIREQTGCTVVAAERGETIVVEFSKGFVPATTDVIYIAGSNKSVTDYLTKYPGTRRGVAG